MDEVMNIVMRGGSMAISAIENTTRYSIKLAAMLKALHLKHSLRGQIPLALLQKQGDTQAFSIPKEYIADFRAEAEKINLYYSVIENEDADMATIAVRQCDIGNFNYIIENIGVVKDDIQHEGLATGDSLDAAKDVGLVVPGDVGTEYYAFEIPADKKVEFMQKADAESIRYADKGELAVTPTAYLREGEALKESYDALVAANKTHSPEAEAVYGHYWPQLSKHPSIEVIETDVAAYDAFKNDSPNMPYAVVHNGNDTLLLAYDSANRETVNEYFSAASEPKHLISKSELTARARKAAAERNEPGVIVVHGDDRDKVAAVCAEKGITPPEFTKVAKSEKFYEDLHHRIERVKSSASQVGTEKEISKGVEKTIKSIQKEGVEL